MQPTLCSKCKKNVAVVFISRQNEKGEMVNEGLCLKCAAQLGLPQVEEMMKRMGISPEDLENINNEMMQAFGGAEELSDMPAPQDEDDEDDGESGKTATFPFLNRLFGGSNPPAEKSDAPSGREEAPKGRKADKKHKYLDSYCINLSQRARDGKLDAVIGRIMLDELRDSLREKGYTFTYDDALVSHLVHSSYSAAYGARNLRRCIQKELEDPMAVQIIDSFEHPITQLRATAEDGKVRLDTL